MKKFLSFLLGMALFSCGGNDPAPGRKFDIYLDYWNTTGQTPQIRFDEMRTSREIKIDFTKTFGGFTEGNNIAKVVIDNFRIIDSYSNNYDIKKIRAFEYRNDLKNWKEDVEFTMEFGKSDNLSVVLVLDRSNSLGSDFANVKTYANNFIDKVFADRKNAKIGIVDFADEIKSFPISSNAAELKSYVNGLQQGRFTTLYDAMSQGVDMLQNDNAQSKVMVVFTDGTDNNSKLNSDGLLTKMKATTTDFKVSTFMIGLKGKGDVDEQVLNKLTINGGVAQFPNSVNELKTVFEKFSRVIANVYNLTYIRNQQKVDRATPIKLRFEIETSAQ